MRDADSFEAARPRACSFCGAEADAVLGEAGICLACYAARSSCCSGDEIESTQGQAPFPRFRRDEDDSPE